VTPKQPQPGPPLTPIGGEIILMGYRFRVAAHSFDHKGHPVEVPGACIGRASKEQIAEQNKPAGHNVPITLNQPMAHARTAEPSRQITPAPRRQKPRRYKASRGDWRRFQKRPPPLKIVYEPTSAAAIWGWVVAIALVVAGIWLYNSGSEQAKWKTIEAASKAGQRR